MKVVGFNLTKVSIERKEINMSAEKVDQKINITDVSKQSVEFSKDELLKINFELSLLYPNDLARLDFKGYVTTIPNSDEMDKFLKSWKDQNIPEDSKFPLFNFIMQKCNVKALYLEDELGLPLHVPMLRIGPGNKAPSQSDKKDPEKKE